MLVEGTEQSQGVCLNRSCLHKLLVQIIGMDRVLNPEESLQLPLDITVPSYALKRRFGISFCSSSSYFTEARFEVSVRLEQNQQTIHRINTWGFKVYRATLAPQTCSSRCLVFTDVYKSQCYSLPVSTLVGYDHQLVHS